jgi:hypothetical protein
MNKKIAAKDSLGTRQIISQCIKFYETTPRTTICARQMVDQVRNNISTNVQVDVKIDKTHP